MQEANAPKKPTVTWGPVAAIIVTLLSFLLAQLAAGLALAAGPKLLGWSRAHSDDWLTSVAGQFLFVLLAESLTLGIVWWYAVRRKRATLAALGFQRAVRWRDVAYMAVGFVVYLAVVAVVTSWASSQFHIDLNQKQELGFDTVIGTWERLLTFISLVVLPPVVEEIMFRGFLFGGLRRRLSFPIVTLLVSVIFASLHLLEGAGGLLWVAGIDTFVLSLVLCYVREKTSNLWAGIGIHMLKNGIAFLYLYVFVAH
ncbi:MAG TPA: type II CAAX endopeptidase family protein [Candidatus Saccharimonadales bacterium]|nr:type II CAAX endopeptidase family protein [Candidatus Saccharimonadales bacterium]